MPSRGRSTARALELCLKDAAKVLGVSSPTVWSWVRKGVLPSRKVGKNVLVPLRVARLLQEQWKCPVCSFRGRGPRGLGDHLQVCHTKEVGRSAKYECPAPECARPRKRFDSVESLLAHLDEHVVARKQEGIGELHLVGKAVSLGKKAKCSEADCTKRVQARGLCWNHYQRARRAKRLREAQREVR